MYFLQLRKKNYNSDSIQDNYTKVSKLLTIAMVDAWLYHFCRFTHSVLHSDEANAKFFPLKPLSFTLSFENIHMQIKLHTHKITMW
jgi:hypothetical protein